MKRKRDRAAKWIAAAAFAVMAFAVLKNIAYPLLWNDEGETAMYAERVLDFGYPKVSDGKNVVYCLELEDKMAGRRTPSGAYLGSGWGHFYFGAIGALAARAADAIAGRTGIGLEFETENTANAPDNDAAKAGTDRTINNADGSGAGTAPDPALKNRGDRPRNADVYLKTALLRIPFALAGLASIVLMVIAMAPLLTGGSAAGRGQEPKSRSRCPSGLDVDDKARALPNKLATTKLEDSIKPKNSSASDSSGQADRRPSTRVWLFAAALFAWQTLSVPWALHMREMRYYSLVSLLLAWVLYLAVRRHTGRMRAGRYGALIFAALVLLLVTFPVAMAGAAAALGLAEIAILIRKRDVRRAVGGIIPLAAVGAAAGIYAVIFRSIPIAAGFAAMFPRSEGQAWKTAVKLFAFFRDYESLWVIAAAVALGAAAAIVSWARERGAIRKDGAAPAFIMGRADRRLVKLSLALVAYMALHVVVLLRLSFPQTYERYFIWLQPAAGLALWLSVFAMGGMVKSLRKRWARRAAAATLAGGFTLLAVFTAGERAPVLRERAYELFHRYTGPVDYAVGFIRRTYPNPSCLVIAANYEECVLQYYLGSKVIVGFVGNNQEEDERLVPDVIVPRKRMTYTNHVIREMIARGGYRERLLPIVDSIVNGSPEVAPGPSSHIFRTRRPQSDQQKLRILIKDKKGSGLKIQD